MLINNIKQITGIEFGELGIERKKSTQIKDDQVSFSDFLKESINNIDALEKDVQEYDYKIATGEMENIHEAMIAAQNADIGLQLTMQVRNKVLDAYREIMRMQI